MTLNGCQGAKSGRCNARPDFWVRADYLTLVTTYVLTCGNHLPRVLRIFKEMAQPTVVTVKVRNPAATGDRWI